ncbi:hypothetical protein [Pseudomonas aegrilactucae]|uniref:Uncharacterized protein n=1 Tax=Pseudomonas aegrilactucae TaxID=2854028 RepID=A0A9Q2XRA8_9PSED|nr:hypothetical protein [Pseudomonas aegrilactucae]MBV6290500.1 hypothetical protein [Pseudomonas aegrilactucae]
MFEVLIHRSKFKYFKKGANGFISFLPASDEDDFSAVMVRDLNGTLGFDVNQLAESILDDLLGECYCLRGSGSVDHPGVFPKGGMPNFFFKNKGDAFHRLVASHERYVLAMKKYSVISRYRHTEKPEPSELSHFLQDDSRIEKPLYESLLSSCEYFGISQGSQEHGWGAFDLISRDMDGFFTKLENLLGDDGRLVFIEKMRDMPCW